MTNLCKSSDLLMRNLHRYESTAVRGYYRAMNMLLKLQAGRRTRRDEEAEVENAQVASAPSPKPKLVPILDEKISRNEPTEPSPGLPRKENDSPRKERN